MKTKIVEFRALAASVALALTTVTIPAYAQDCEVKIGAVGPLSGGASAWGLAAKEGAEFIATLVNSDGGLQIGDSQVQGECRVLRLAIHRGRRRGRRELPRPARTSTQPSVPWVRPRRPVSGRWRRGRG